MKKAKILAVFGILLAMGITACNKGGDEQSQETPVTSEQQGGGETSAHTHKFGAWTETKAPTCTEKGSKERVCECGEKETAEVAALGHDFKNGTVTADTSTCSADGKQTIKCARCDVTQEVDVKAHHRFGEEAAVAAKGDGYVGYKKAECSVDHVLQLKIRALDGTLASGSSIKSGTADGYFKLSSNGHSISWKFDYQPSSGKTGAIGTVYTLGFMDAWSSNSSKKYGVYSTSSQDTRDAGNFDFTVNGNLVDKKAYMQKTFEELTAGGADSSKVGDNYSPIALIPVGEVVLNSGDNTFVYKRTGSYNFVISDLVFIGSEFSHEHTAGTAWESDENNHWHVCTAPGCPVDGGYQMEKAAHTFGAKYDEVDATCSAPGSYKEKCTVCDYVKETTVPKLAHTYANDGAYTQVKPATCSEEGLEERECTVCHEKETRKIAKAAHNYEAVQSFAADTTAGTIASSAYACKVCEETVLEWAAKDFDATLSTDDAKLVEDGAGVQMTTPDKTDPSSRQAGGSYKAETVGTRYVYKIDAYEAAQNVGLSFKIKMNSSNTPHVFAFESSDWTPGYVQNAAGEWVKSEFRYGLFVNGNNVPLGEDKYGTGLGNKVDWFDFNVKFDVVKGLNTIEILCLGGYPAQAIYSYRLVGMPKIENTHEHILGDWQANDDEHWKLCSATDCPVAGEKLDKAAHTFGAKYDEVEATCDHVGGYKEKCSVCNYVKETVIAKKAHEFDAQPADSTDKDTTAGTIATAAYNCKNCNESVLRWSALDYDTTSTKVDKHTAYIRFNGCQYLNKDISDKGSHIIYKIKASAATNVSLAFEAEASSSGPLFNSVQGDGSVGYEVDGEGNFIEQKVRYGLLVNGVKVEFGPSSSENANGAKLWHQFPVTFDLQEGVNTIDLYQLGGYRAKMYNFQITGLPHVTPSHSHTLGEFQHDAVHHWKECSGEGCPAGAGAHIDEASHIVPTTAQTDEAESKIGTCECGVTRILWDARKFNAEGSKVGKPNTTDNGSTGITFSGDPYNKNGAEGVGDHALYKVNVPAAQTSAQLVMRFNRKDANKAFSAISGDGSPGYVLKDGEYVKADWRYKVLVNGVEVELVPYTTENPEPMSVAKTEVEFAFPCTFALNEGINTIELQKYGGYTPVIVNLSLVY